MIRHFGPEPPWTAPAKYREGSLLCSYGTWVEVDSLFDGTRVWEYRDGARLTTFLDLLERLTPRFLTEKVRWLEDDFLPKRPSSSA